MFGTKEHEIELTERPIEFIALYNYETHLLSVEDSGATDPLQTSKRAKEWNDMFVHLKLKQHWVYTK